MVLVSGLAAEAAEAWRTRRDGPHLAQQLKFLTVRTEADKKDGRVERSGITALGGPHDAALDGAIAGPEQCAPAAPAGRRAARGARTLALLGCIAPPARPPASAGRTARRACLIGPAAAPVAAGRA